MIRMRPTSPLLRRDHPLAAGTAILFDGERDAGPNRHPLTLVDVAASAGPWGRCASFNGSSSYINAGTLMPFGASPGRVQQRAGITILALFRAATDTDEVVLFGNRRFSTPGLGFMLNRNNFGSLGTGHWSLYWQQSGSRGWRGGSATNSGLTGGEWHRMAITIATQGDTMQALRWWRDGVFTTIANNAGGISDFQSWSITPYLAIGADVDGSGTVDGFWNGEIGMLQIINRPVPDEQILNWLNDPYEHLRPRRTLVHLMGLDSGGSPPAGATGHYYRRLMARRRFA